MSLISLQCLKAIQLSLFGNTEKFNWTIRTSEQLKISLLGWAKLKKWEEGKKKKNPKKRKVEEVNFGWIWVREARRWSGELCSKPARIGWRSQGERGKNLCGTITRPRNLQQTQKNSEHASNWLTCQHFQRGCPWSNAEKQEQTWDFSPVRYLARQSSKSSQTFMRRGKTSPRTWARKGGRGHAWERWHHLWRQCLNEPSSVTHGELLELSARNASSRHPLAASHAGGFCDDRRSWGPIAMEGTGPWPHQLCH